MNTRALVLGFAGGLVFKIALENFVAPETAFFFSIATILAIAIGLTETRGDY